MKRILTTYGLLMVMNLLFVQPCLGNTFFKVILARDAIYSPGEIHLTLELTDRARIEGEYEFRIHVYITGVLVRKQIVPATRNELTHFDLTFPPIQGKTNVRYRVELFINGEFIESRELPLTLYPASEPFVQKQINKTIWVFDISGRLQKILDDLEVEAVDATFQSARNFGTPEVVFIGEDLDPNSMQLITDRLALAKNKPLIIFLKQKQLLRDLGIDIPEIDRKAESIECDFDCRLLRGLGRRDVMSLLNSTVSVKIKRDDGKSIDSDITEVDQDNKNMYSYLCTIEERNRTTIHCQLRVTDDKDPRCGILLKNLLKLANEIEGT
jgi:hypothetical protein